MNATERSNRFWLAACAMCLAMSAGCVGVAPIAPRYAPTEPHVASAGGVRVRVERVSTASDLVCFDAVVTQADGQQVQAVRLDTFREACTAGWTARLLSVDGAHWKPGAKLPLHRGSHLHACFHRGQKQVKRAFTQANVALAVVLAKPSPCVVTPIVNPEGKRVQWDSVARWFGGVGLTALIPTGADPRTGSLTEVKVGKRFGRFTVAGRVASGGLLSTGDTTPDTVLVGGGLWADMHFPGRWFGSAMGIGYDVFYAYSDGRAGVVQGPRIGLSFYIPGHGPWPGFQQGGLDLVRVWAGLWTGLSIPNPSGMIGLGVGF